MQFIYVLLGWEGSASASRVLRDVVSRRNGLKIPKGCYYLCDVGYTNGEKVLAPYRGQQYHLNDWMQRYQPRTPSIFFNMKHSSARNVIERAFGLLKGRWAILRGKSYYPVKVQCQMITTCCLIHNIIRREMFVDPLEDEAVRDTHSSTFDMDSDRITHVESSNEWTNWRDNLAIEMFEEWRGISH